VLKDGEMPDLEGVWALMDGAWEECGCNPEVCDERIARFYSHPVWLLNGLFVEQHAESIQYRQKFADFVASLNPKRVADIGGGYGSLARMIGERSLMSEIHVVEPYPHQAAVSLAEQTSNVRYMKRCSGPYDVMVATDVFEHSFDPLKLVEDTATHLNVGGVYLMGNCFWPVIRCHLPSKFHFRWSWDAAMAAMGFRAGKTLDYARAFKKVGPISADGARRIERRSMRLFSLIERVPWRYRDRAARFAFPVTRDDSGEEQ
jgi:hypothetical protein